MIGVVHHGSGLLFNKIIGSSKMTAQLLSRNILLLIRIQAFAESESGSQVVAEVGFNPA